MLSAFPCGRLRAHEKDKPSFMITTFLQQLINGISQGSAYALIALGYTMVYGVLGLINFAHSDVYMFGAFMGYYIANSQVVRNQLGSSLGAAVVVMIAAMALSAVLGMLIERFAYRPGRTRTRFTLAFWLGILGAVFGRSSFAFGIGCDRWSSRGYCGRNRR